MSKGATATLVAAAAIVCLILSAPAALAGDGCLLRRCDEGEPLHPGLSDLGLPAPTPPPPPPPLVRDVVHETRDVVDEAGDVVQNPGDLLDETRDVVEEADDPIDEVIGGLPGGDGPDSDDPDDGNGTTTSGGTEARPRSHPANVSPNRIRRGGEAERSRPDAIVLAASPDGTQTAPAGTALSGGPDQGDALIEFAERWAFPFGLLLALGVFLAIQNHLDRRDPKLALAPLDSSSEWVSFE